MMTLWTDPARPGVRICGEDVQRGLHVKLRLWVDGAPRDELALLTGRPGSEAWAAELAAAVAAGIALAESVG